MSPVMLAALQSWAFPPGITIALLLAGLVYWRGWKRLRQTRRAQFPAWRLLCFWTGLLTLWIAVASPLDAFGGLLLWVHMTQHLVLMSVAPPLILLGAPVVPILRGIPRGLVRGLSGPLFSSRILHGIGRFLTRPIVCWLAMTLAYLGWHLTPAYELTLRSPAWHEVEHACFFFSCILFWWPVILPWPAVARGSRWMLLPYLVSGDLVNTGLSAFLCFSGRVLYPTYGRVPRIFEISALQDQIAAGSLMWVLGSTIFLLPAVVITIQLLSPGLKNFQAPAQPLAGHVAVQKPFDLLKMPLLGALLRARYGRMMLQAITLIAAIIVILHGILGHPMGAMNLAGILPWTYARALGVIALLAAGNLFCMACPFMLPRELGHRLGLATRSWPHWLRNKWMSAFLLILFFWFFEVFAVWDRPSWTAWLIIGYFVAAFVTDTFFRGASFCKYVCPIGQFNFVSSLVSPLELQSASSSVCGACKTHDCIVGNAHQRGCELQLFVPQKVGNLDCTLCMDCVKACPHDNIVILAGAPGRDLIGDPMRSSIGRLSSRDDIAAVALIIVSAAFASAAVMVSPVDAMLQNASRSVSHFTGLALGLVVAMVLPLLLFVMTAASSYALTGFAQGTHTARTLARRLASALLPLGLATWTAHLLFHLAIGWDTLFPGIVQAMNDFGIRVLGSPHWQAATSILASNSLLSLQLLVLDGGLLLTLYIGWRTSRAAVNHEGRTLLAMLPWACLVFALYGIAVWIVLQPMQMRNMVHG